jgi:hypothetical protein
LITFGELDSFPSGFVAYNLYEEAGGINASKASFHTLFLQKILGFIFPKDFLDIDLYFLLGPDTIALFGSSALVDGSIPNLNYFTIKSTDTVGSAIEKILNSTFGYLVFDEITGKITARSGYATFIDYTYLKEISFGVYVDTPTLPTPYVINTEKAIYDYKDETLSTDTVYNYLAFALYKDTLLQAYQFISFLGTKSFELKANAKTTLFFGDSDFDIIAAKIVILNNFYLSSWAVTPDSTSVAYNNSGVGLSSYGILGDRVFIEFNNTNSSSRFLRALVAKADILVFQKDFSYISFDSSNPNPTPKPYDAEILDQTSINRYGKKVFDIDDFYAYAGVDSGGLVQTPVLYRLAVQKLKDPAEVVQAEIQYTPELRVGAVVQIRNKDRRMLKAHLLENQTYSQNKEYVKTITAREIK